MTDPERPLVRQTPAGFQVSFRGRDLYPADPIAASARKAQSLPLEPDTLYIVCSPLLWYGVAELAARLPAGSALALVELEPALSALVDWGGQAAALGVDALAVVHPDPLEAGRRLAAALTPRTKRVACLSLNGGRLLLPDAYRALQAAMDREIRRYWRNRSTVLHLGKLWVRNFLTNLRDAGAARSLDEFPAQPRVLVCAAGPSLEACVPWIKREREGICLVAVDTALPILAAHGLDVDLVVALEAQIANLQDFVSAGRRVRAIAYDLSSSPPVVRSCGAARRWVFSSRFAECGLWERAERHGVLPLSIPPLGSVGVCALYLARWLSSDEIYLAGLDFGYRPGLTHARHSPAYAAHARRHDRLSGSFPETASLGPKAKRVAGLGGELLSDDVLLSYGESAREVVAYLVGQGRRVRDLRSSGLPLGVPEPPPQARARADAVPAGAASEHSAAATALLAELLEDISALSAAVAARIPGAAPAAGVPASDAQAAGAPAPEDAALLAGLARLDFLFFDFADRDWPNLAPQALVRATITLDYYAHFLKRLLSPRRT